jgi:hypothetical protein
VDALNQHCAFAHIRANKLCNPARWPLVRFGECCASTGSHVQAKRSLVFSPDYLAEPLTPDPLPTKDGGVLRTIGDVRAYMLALSEERQWLDHWKSAYRLLVHGAGAVPLTLQVYVALSKDSQLDLEAFDAH